MTEKKPRQSNIELLRIIAMFMILIIHADFWALGVPLRPVFEANATAGFWRTFFEAVGIGGVDIFVLISGWFGIRFTLKSFGNLIFQCLYFLGGIYVVMLLLGLAEPDWEYTREVFLFAYNNWFVRAYICLFILAPVLNAYLEKCTRRQLGITVACFYIFQTVYGYFGDDPSFQQGYATISFMGLYLLARYMRLYGQRFYRYGLAAYIASVVLLTAWFCGTVAGVINLGVPIMSYINPVTVIGSVGILVWFSDRSLCHSRIINFVSASSFAVFLLHCNAHLGKPVYCEIVSDIYEKYSGLACAGLIFLFLAGVFALAVALDQPRKWLWRQLLSAV